MTRCKLNNILKERRGSALLWAVFSIMILMLVAVTVTSVAAASGSRSLREQSARQAALTARSAADMAVSWLEGRGAYTWVYETDEYGNLFYDIYSDGPVRGWNQSEAVSGPIPEPVGNTLPLTFSFDQFQGQMGEISEAAITRASQSELEVKVTATVGGVAESLSARLQLALPDAPVPDDSAAATLGEIFGMAVIMGLEAEGGQRISVNGDFYLGNALVGGSGESTLTISGGTLFYGRELHEPIGEGYDCRIPGEDAYISISNGSAEDDGLYYGLFYGVGPYFNPSAALKGEGQQVPFAKGLKDLAAGVNYVYVQGGEHVLDLSSLPVRSETYVFLLEGARLTLLGSNDASRPVYIHSPQGCAVEVVSEVALTGGIAAGQVNLRGPGAAFEVICVTPTLDTVVRFEDKVLNPAGAPLAGGEYEWSFTGYGK